MDPDAEEALGIIRRCVKARRYELRKHFRDQMAARGMFWGDVLAILDRPTDFREGIGDTHNRPKWILAGAAADGLGVELVCVIDQTGPDDSVLFVTIY